VTELEAARQYVGTVAHHADCSRQWKAALVADAIDRFEAAVRADEANRNGSGNGPTEGEAK
jgi:predicted component of type VI protein secretion system